MQRIDHIRTVLLTSPYGNSSSRENQCNFPNGPHKSIGMVEITLDDGTTGLGEGYLAVFAPRVFEQIVRLVAPYLLGKEAFDISARVRDLCTVCDYWSAQGAARHVISAIEIALVDAKAKRLGLPAYELFGGKQADTVPVYGSGGDSDSPKNMQQELETIQGLGIRLFKMRSLSHEIKRTVWTLEAAGKAGIRVGVDMVQSLANPAQTMSDVVRYVNGVHGATDQQIVFLEEPLGPMDQEGFRLLRSKVSPQVCGGETVTTPQELCRQIADGRYDFVQPDASVIGGISAVMDVFSAARTHGSAVVVHAWGGAAGMMANYHAAFAGGGTLIEYPLPWFPIREELMTQALRIEKGAVLAPTAPGIGVTLTPELEKKYSFREEAVYHCPGAAFESLPDAAWI